MRGIKIKYSEQEENIIKSMIINGNTMVEIIKEVLNVSPHRSSDALFHAVRKFRRDLKTLNAIPDKSVYFYTDEQLEILNNEIKSGKSLRQIARTYCDAFNRTEHNLYTKILKMKNATASKAPTSSPSKASFYTEEQIIEMISLLKTRDVKLNQLSKDLAIKYNKTEYSTRFKLYELKKKIKVGEFKDIKQVNVKKTVKKPSNLNFEPDVEKQQPADIGVDVPHGMTFEGKPKRITLHSDHFRIYF